LDLNDEQLDVIVNIPPLKYEKHTSKMNRLFAILMKLKKCIKK